MTPKLSGTSTITQSLSPYLGDFIETYKIPNCARGHAMFVLCGYILDVDLKWGKRIQGPLSEWKHRGEQWVPWSSNHLTFGVLERIAC
jgi:hypothetical protein